MLLIHTVTAIASSAILTFSSNCSADSPCIYTAISVIALYSISNSLWKIIFVLVSLSVRDKYHSTAYGLMSCA